MMIENFDQLVEVNNYPNWPYNPDNFYRILIIGVSESKKSNMLLNLIKINDQILTKFIYTSKTHSNQGCLLTKEKK